MELHEEYLKKFNRCINEYTNAAGSYGIEEAEEEPQSQNTPMDDNSGAPDMGMPQDTSQAPEQEMLNGQQGVEGFAPQGAQPNAPIDGMGGQEAPQAPEAEQPSMDREDEVIDVDDLVKAQEKAEKKIDSMTGKFDKLMDAVEALVKKNNERDEQDAERLEAIRKEIELRNPTPMQKLSSRAMKGGPFNQTVEDYMEHNLPDNYSAEDDNNGEDDPQYKILKSDIDGFTDYNSIARELDVEHQNLKDILGY